MICSPYEGQPVAKWAEITNSLIANHPLNEKEVVDVVLEAWNKIQETKIGGELKIGQDVFPRPQIIGEYLHLLIAYSLEKQYPGIWRREIDKNDKDIVYISDDSKSIEIKTSSQNSIYGNRSYGQENSEGKTKKLKYGYYLAIIFEKYTVDNHNPSIRTIKFGWLDHDDWKAQKAATGQNSTLDKNAWMFKLKTLYEA